MKYKTITDLRTGKVKKIPMNEALEEVRKDIGDKLYYQLSPEGREFIASIVGIIDFSETFLDRVLIKFKLKKSFADRVIDNLRR